MTFANLLMSSLRTVNNAPPEKRAAILPVRDVGSFREAVAGLQRSMERPEVQHFADAAQSVEQATNVSINTHVFAPPGMEMS